jgi:gliding motility-associated-like protein
MSTVTCSGVPFVVTPANNTNGIVPADTRYSWGIPTSSPFITGGASDFNKLSISGTLSNSTNLQQTAVYTVSPSAGSCIGLPFTLNVDINPTVIVAPMSTVICSGNSFALTPVNGENGNIVPAGTTYRWNVPTHTGSLTGGASGSGQSDINGRLNNLSNTVRTAVYTVFPTTPSCLNIASFTVTVIVRPIPVISQMTTIICSALTFTVTPTNNVGGNIVPAGTLYEWNVPVVTGSMTGGQSGANSPNISGTLINPSIIAQQTASYTVVPRTADCVGAAFTLVVHVSVSATITNMSTVVCTGVPFVVSPTHVINGIVPNNTTYSWSVPTMSASISGGQSAINRTSITGILVNSSFEERTATYMVTPQSGACTGVPFSVTVFVKSGATINPMSVTTCSGVAFNITPLNGVNGVITAGTTYRWLQAPTGIGIAGGASQTTYVPSIFGLLHNTTNITRTATYSVVASVPICGDVATFTLVVFVNPIAAINTITRVICSEFTFTVNPTNIVNGIVPAGTNYTWMLPNAPNITGGAAQITPTNQITGYLKNETNSTQTATYVVTPIAPLCGAGQPFTLIITVNPKPAVNSFSTTLCSGVPFEITPVNGVDGIIPDNTNYSWNVPAFSYLVSGGQSRSGVSSVFGVLTNNTNVVQTALYMVTPTAGDCPGNSFSVSIVLNPIAVINTITAVVCSNSSFDILPVDLINGIVPAGTVYSWNVPSITASIVGGQSNENQASITGTLSNRSNIVQTATYQVTPTTPLCGVNQPFSLIIALKPTAEITDMSTTTCGGVVFTVEPAQELNGIVPAGTNYTWLDPTGTGFTGGVSQTSPVSKIQGKLVNISSSIATATYTVTPVSDGCTGNAFTVTVQILPVNLISEMSVTTCDGVPFAVSPVDGVNGVVSPNTTYKWAAPTGSGFTGGQSQTTFVPEIYGTLNNTVNYQVTVTYIVLSNDPVCGTIANPFTLTVYLNPTAYITAMTAETCTGLTFAVSPVNGIHGIVPDGTTFTWSAPSSDSFITGGSAGSGNDINGTLFNSATIPGTATYTVIPATSACGPANSFTLLMTVNPYPNITAMTTTTCSGVLFVVSPVNGVNGNLLPTTTYSWDIPIYSSVSMSGGAANINQPFISGTLNNLTDISQFGTYTIFPTYRGCTGNAFTLVAEILPIPRFKDITILTGMAPRYPFTLTPTTSIDHGIVPAGTIYRWNAPTYSSPSLTGGVAATNQLNINGALSHKSTQILEAYYRVTPSTVACGDGSQFTLTARVTPLPFINAMTSVICSEASFALTPVNNVNGVVPNLTTYSWSAPQVTGGLSGGAAAANVTNLYGSLVNPTNTVQTAVYTIIPKSFYGFEGDPFTLTVTVNPIATITEMSTVTCDGVTFTLTPSNSINGVVPVATLYKWSAPTGSGYSNGASQTTYVSSVTGRLTNNTNVLQSATYLVQTISGNCIGKVFTTVVYLEPSAKINPITLSYCTGATFTITPTHAINGIVPDGTLYTWSAPTGTGFSGGLSQTTPIPAITGTLFNFNNYEVTATYTINAISGNCIGAVFTTTIILTPAPQVKIALGSQTVCLSTIPSTLVLEVSGGAGSASYSWYYNTTSSYIGATQLSATTSTFTPPAPDNLDSRYYFAKIKFSAGGCEATSNNIHELRVNRYATADDLNVDPVVVCSGLSTTLVGALSPTSDIINPIYRWYRDSNLKNFAFEGPVYNTPIMNNNSSFYVTVRGTNACNNLPGTAQKVDVVVSTFAPNMIKPVDVVSCIGNIVNVAFTSVYPDVIFIWSNSNTAIGLDASGTSQNFSFVAQNANTSNQTAIVTVVPSVNGCTGIPQTFSITVSPAVPSVGTLQVTTPSGERLNFNPILPLNGNSYTWSAPVPAGITGVDMVVTTRSTVFNPQMTNTTLAPILVPFVVQPYSQAPGNCAGTPFMILVTVNPVPRIPDQIVSTCSGLLVEVSPTNVPAKTTYTWDLPVIVSGSVSGVMAEASPNPVFRQTINNTGSTMAIVRYTVVPTSDGVVGGAFTITVQVQPKPQLIDANPVVLCNQVPFTYTAQSLTVGTVINWSRAAVNNIANPAASGSTLINETLVNTSPEPIQVKYVFTLSANGCSNTQEIPVQVYPTYRLSSPKSVVICSNNSLNYKATSSNNVLFNWSRTAVAGISNADTTGNTSNINEKLINTTNVPIQVKYKFILSGGICPGTDSLLVTVNPEPIVNPVADVQYCSNTNVQIQFTGSGVANTTYEWTNSFAGIGLFTSGTGDLNFIPFNTSSAPVNARIRVTPVANGCSGATYQFTVTVNPNPVLSSQLNIPTVCSGAPVRYTPTSSVAGATYSWTRPAVPGIDNPASSGTGPIDEVLTNSASAPLNVRYIFTTTANGCSSTQMVNVLVNPEVRVNNPGYQLVCSNTPRQVVFAGSIVAGTQYNWTNDNTATGIAASGIGSIFFITNNNTSDTLSSNITVTPRANGCNGTPVSFRLTVNPLPVLTSSLTPPAVCSNNNFNYLPTSNVAQTIFNWTRPAVGGIANLPSAGTGAIGERLINNTTGPITVIYQVTLINNGCSNRQNVAVVVNPALSLSNSNFNFTVCSKLPFRFVPQSINPVNQFQWSREAVPGISNAAQTGSGIIDETLINTTNAPIVVTYRYSLINPSPCSADQLVFVTVRPAPALSSPKQITVCSNVPVGYTPESNLLGSNFSWSRASVAGIANGPGVGLVTINERLINTTTAPVDVRYIYNLTNSNGCNNVDTVVVQVRPVPVTNYVSDISVCANTTAAAITFTSNIPGTLFNWVNSDPAIGLPASGSGNIAPWTAINTSNGQLNATIFVTPEIGGCKGNTITAAKILVNRPITNFSILSAPPVACPGNLVGPFVASVPFGGDGYSYVFQWQRSTTVGGPYLPIANQTSRQLVAAPPVISNTWYRLQVTSGGCVQSTSPVLVTLGINPTALISNIDNFVINVGNSTQLLGSGLNGTSFTFEWSPRNLVSDFKAQNPFVNPTSDTRFNLRVTNQDGCSDTTSAMVYVLKGLQIFPNNVLTPNGDGYNDTWKIRNIEFYPKNSIKIYNANSQLVKSLGEPTQPGGYKGDWDGRSETGGKLPTGVYYYVIDLNDGSAIIKGFLTILN